MVRAVKEEPTMAKWPADHMTCLNRGLKVCVRCFIG